MVKSDTPRPTDAELEILKVLWQRGPGTVRDIHESLNSVKEVGYTTVLKMLQIMAEKGLVERDESQRAHIYKARRAEEATLGQMVRDLLDRAFDGSAARLVQQALAAKKTSRAELSRIRALLDRLERGEK